MLLDKDQSAKILYKRSEKYYIVFQSGILYLIKVLQNSSKFYSISTVVWTGPLWIHAWSVVYYNSIKMVAQFSMNDALQKVVANVVRTTFL